MRWPGSTSGGLALSEPKAVRFDLRGTGNELSTFGPEMLEQLYWLHIVTLIPHEPVPKPRELPLHHETFH
jgi:hypothetical protein